MANRRIVWKYLLESPGVTIEFISNAENMDPKVVKKCIMYFLQQKMVKVIPQDYNV